MTDQEKASKSSTSRRRLGRGLGSLIAAPVQVQVPAGDPQPAVAPAAEPGVSPAEAGPEIAMLGRHEIQPNPRQPRQRFDPASLRSLADSIINAGLMQPLVVRPAEAGGFELVAGERRWRAAELAGLDRVPAIVRRADDQTAAEWSLIENLHREDLNPIERGEAFRRLIDEFDLGHQEIAERVGLDRSSVTNHLRLLSLDEATREAIGTGRLTAGHGKALLAITNIKARQVLGSEAVKRQWSVRELERRVRSLLRPAAKGKKTTSRPVHPHMVDLQRRLSEHLGTRVQLTPGRKKGTGKLIIEFYDLEQFEGLMQRLQFDHD